VVQQEEFEMTQATQINRNRNGNGNGPQQQRDALDRHNDDLPVMAPPVDIYENAEEFLVVADLPGVAPENVSVRLAGDRLELEARQVFPEEQRAQLSPSRFVRSFLVPDSIDAASVNAKTENGVLTIHLRKAEARKPKQIAVTAG
jgi:HSP20 family molecular chaperone IbpA